MERGRGFDNPVDYATEFLKVKLWSRQEEILRKVMEPPYKVLVRSGHNVGKSFTGAVFASWFYDQHDPGICLVTAPKADSIRDLLFADLRKLRSSTPHQATGFLPIDTRLESSPEHYVYGFTARGSEGFQGRHKRNLALLYEEAVGIAEPFFQAGKTMVTGSPGHYWICFYNPTDPTSQIYHEESTGNWHLVTLSQLEHPNIQAELQGLPPIYPDAVRLQQVIDQLDEYGERICPDAPPQPEEVSLSPDYRWLPGPLADARVLGRWPQSSGNTVWSEADLRKLSDMVVQVNPDWRVQIGCDVARYGYDDTCIVVKQGIAIVHSERHNGWSLKQTSNRLRILAEQYKGPHSPKEVPILIDGAGIGAGVVDYGEGFNFLSILGISPAREEAKYYNTRCELWFNSRDHCREGLVDISRMEAKEQSRLKAELGAVTYDVDPRGRYRVEAKLSTRSKIKRSPDLADAFNLACYWLHS